MNRNKMFATVNICGGLGNQLFQLATLLKTSQDNKVSAFVERLPLSSSCNEPRPTYWTTLLSGLNPVISPTPPPDSLQDVVVPETRPVRPLTLPPPAVGNAGCVYRLVGFFQSAQFFDGMEGELHRLFVPPRLAQEAVGHLHEYYNPMENPDVHFIALHVRRGDYLTMKDTFAILEHDYYDAAVRQLLGSIAKKEELRLSRSSSTTKRFALLIFSEDEVYGATLAGYFKTKFSGLHTQLVRTEEGYKACMPRDVLELLMMAQCQDVVMANSSFSWWAAYLNKVPLARIVAPSRWFVKEPLAAHIYCKEWLVL